jgi:type IV secretory pathway VirB9-like protein
LIIEMIFYNMIDYKNGSITCWISSCCVPLLPSPIAVVFTAPPNGSSSCSRAQFADGNTIEGDNPPWRPVNAYDDGREVYIEFSPGIGQGEMPPLFVIGQDGKPELVNYRV